MELEKNWTKNRQLVINIIAQLMAFVVNLGVGFFLTPYIIKTVGSTAYGFVGLANNFVSYVQILTTALNSMAGRFIAISFYKGDIEDVKKYYTSVFFSNLFISIIISIPCALILVFLNKIVNVPDEILGDVRLLWGLIFGTMIVSIVGSIFNNAAYVKNRLELISLRTIESNAIRAILLIAMFWMFTPKVWYVGIASLICTIYVICINVIYTKKLMPMVKIRRKYFEFAKIKELIASGIWNSVAQIGNVLSTGLDLLITNIFVGAGSMGVVSVSKTVPTYVQSLFITISSAFAPQLTISFAQEDKDGMKEQLATAMKFMGLFASIPIAVIVAYGKSFYHLWVPSQDARILTYLTCAAVLEYPISLLVYPLENIFATTNHVKISSTITIATSLCSCITVLLAVQFTKTEYVKMMIVVGTSCIYNMLRNGVFIPVICAKILDINSLFFYKIIGKSIFSTVILSFISICLKRFIAVSTWGMLIVACVVIGVVGLVINILFLLNKSERRVFKQGIMNRIHR